MISEAPLAATAGLLTLADQARAYVVVARAKAADGLTISELSELLVSGMRLGIAAVDDVAGMTGAERKAQVLELVGRLFDEFADKAIPLAVYPLWLLVKPAARALALSLASGAVESLLPLVRETK
jgi:hypothetical protein